MGIILASKSPRRKELLHTLGIHFTAYTADTDESCQFKEADKLVTELALRKAKAAYDQLKKADSILQGDIVIGCDTVVCLEGEILGKPKSRADAERMLRHLSGKEHTVTSGIAIIAGEGIRCESECTKVIFDTIPEEELCAYLDTNEPYDKAGAYAIQGLAARWIKGIEGSYHNVVGLPTSLLYRTAREMGIGEFDLSRCKRDEMI